MSATGDPTLADASGRTVDEAGGRLGGLGGRFQRLRGLRSSALFSVFVLIIVIGALASDNFLTGSNAINIATQTTRVGIIVIGMTFVILAGGIDLSVGAITALASVVATEAFVQDLGTLPMVLVCIAVGLGLGLVNGALVAYGKVVAFIATLAMLATARGIALRLTEAIPNISSAATFNTIGTGRWFGVPIPVYVFALLCIIAWVLLNRTTFGRRTIALGGNAEAARLAGIDVRRHTLLLYGFSGLMCGLAAVVITAQLASGSPNTGLGYELDAIAAVIIGGTALSGGRGTLTGSIIGILILTTLTNIFTLLNYPSDIRQIAQGIIIVVAVLLQGRQRSS